MSYRDDSGPVSSPEQPSSAPKHTPPAQQSGPVRGRPLIFAAMEATATSEAHNIKVEPEVLGLIGDLSAAAKTAEGYSAYAYGQQGGYHTPNSTPPPPPPLPEKEVERSRHRKLSKPRHHASTRNTDVKPPKGEGDRPSPVRNGSSKGTPPRRAEVVESQSSVHHRSPSKSVSPNTMPMPQISSSVVQPAPQGEQDRRVHDLDQRGRNRSMSQETRGHPPSREAVKPLTDRQLERLNNGTSHASGAVRQSEPQTQPSKRVVHEERSAAYLPPPHKLSYKSTHHFVPMHSAENVNPQSLQPKRSHQSGKLSSSNGSMSRRPLPQLPTPPDEATPVWPQKERRERHFSPPSNHVRDVHDKQHEDPDHHLAEADREISPEPQFYPLVAHLADPILLEHLLIHISYSEWLTLASVSKEVRRALYVEGREPVLERYLRTVGYARWSWNIPEPLMLTVEVWHTDQ